MSRQAASDLAIVEGTNAKVRVQYFKVVDDAICWITSLANVPPERRRMSVPYGNWKTIPDFVGVCISCPRDKSPLSGSSIRLHNGCHAEIPLFTCECCGKAFKHRTSLARHRNKCAGTTASPACRPVPDPLTYVARGGRRQARSGSSTSPADYPEATAPALPVAPRPLYEEPGFWEMVNSRLVSGDGEGAAPHTPAGALPDACDLPATGPAVFTPPTASGDALADPALAPVADVADVTQASPTGALATEESIVSELLANAAEQARVAHSIASNLRPRVALGGVDASSISALFASLVRSAPLPLGQILCDDQTERAQYLSLLGQHTAGDGSPSLDDGPDIDQPAQGLSSSLGVEQSERVAMDVSQPVVELTHDAALLPRSNGYSFAAQLTDLSPVPIARPATCYAAPSPAFGVVPATPDYSAGRVDATTSGADAKTPLLAGAVVQTSTALRNIRVHGNSVPSTPDNMGAVSFMQPNNRRPPSYSSPATYALVPATPEAANAALVPATPESGNVPLNHSSTTGWADTSAIADADGRRTFLSKWMNAPTDGLESLGDPLTGSHLFGCAMALPNKAQTLDDFCDLLAPIANDVFDVPI